MTIPEISAHCAPDFAESLSQIQQSKNWAIFDYFLEVLKKLKILGLHFG